MCNGSEWGADVRRVMVRNGVQGTRNILSGDSVPHLTKIYTSLAVAFFFCPLIGFISHMPNVGCHALLRSPHRLDVEMK